MYILQLKSVEKRNFRVPCLVFQALKIIQRSCLGLRTSCFTYTWTIKKGDPLSDEMKNLNWYDLRKLSSFISEQHGLIKQEVLRPKQLRCMILRAWKTKQGTLNTRFSTDFNCDMYMNLEYYEILNSSS